MTSAIHQFANTAQLLIWVAEALPIIGVFALGLFIARRNRAL